MRILEMMRKLSRDCTSFTLSLLNVYTCLLTETINLKLNELKLSFAKVNPNEQLLILSHNSRN